MPSVVKTSLLIAVYQENNQLFSECLHSINGQTETDFEVIIVDDGMTDRNLEIFNKLKNQKYRYVKNAQRLGLTKSLNQAAQIAQGDFLARIDSDDVCLPSRLKRQREFLEQYPDYVLCGGMILERDENSLLWLPPAVPFFENDQELKKILACYNPFSHSALMMKKKVFEEVGGYNENFKFAQDYDLIARLSKRGKIKNLPEVVVKRVISKKSISYQKRKQQIWFSLRARFQYWRSTGLSLMAMVYLVKSVLSLLTPNALYQLKRRS
jgi:glycosyltransferase involved in cell wall biosynthesis